MRSIRRFRSALGVLSTLSLLSSGWFGASVIAAGPASAAATTFYVGTTQDQNDGGACTTQGNTDCSLRDAIIAANGNANPADTDVIQVPAGTYPLTIGGSNEDASSTGDLDITQNVSINAPDGATVDASGLVVQTEGGPQAAPDRVFHIHGVTATLNELTITGGSGVEEGGGVSNNGGTLHLIDCVVESNSADADGGGIYAGAAVSTATTTLSGTSVSGNAALEGGGIYNGAGDTLTVADDSTVGDNDAFQQVNTFSGNGGGIYNAGHTTVSDSTVGGDGTGNTAGRLGGGIYTSPPQSMTLTLENAEVSNNVAASDGGGIYNSGDRVTLSGTDVFDNEAGVVHGEASFFPGGNGGGIYSDAETDQSTSPPGLYVSDGSHIFRNIAYLCDASDESLNCSNGPPTGNGGGIWMSGHAEVSIDSIVGGDPDGAARYTDGNTAQANGGGIYDAVAFDGCGDCATLLVTTGSAIGGNLAGYDGGGIYNEGDHVELDDVVVAYNAAGWGDRSSDALTGGSGGGVWNAAVPQSSCDPATSDGCPGVFVTGSSISFNSAYRCDAGCATHPPGQVADGGGIYNEGRVELRDGTAVDNNSAQNDGGGIWTTAFSIGTLLLDGTTVARNVAIADGGGIYNEFDHVEIDNSTITQNIAGAGQGGNGGGIWNGAQNFGGEEPGGLYVTRTLITSNHAFDCGECGGGNGGGIWNSGHAELSQSTHVDGNTADFEGGGIWTSAPRQECPCTLLVTDSTVNDNTAASDGGGIYNDSDEVTLTRITIDGNRAGILIRPGEGGPQEIVTGGDGGGIYNEESQSRNLLEVSHSAIARNEATMPNAQGASGGGGIWNGSRADIFDSTVSSNTTNGRGGGIYGLGFSELGSSTTQVRSSTVAFNHAGADGGGIAVGADEAAPHVSLHNSIVALNTRDESEGPGTTPSDCSEEQEGEIVSNGYNLDSDGSCNLTQPTDKPSMDPVLGPLQNNGGPTETHALLDGSPAIDTGAPPGSEPGCPSDDQRGVARPQGPGCDIGAYERTTGGTGQLPGDLGITKSATPDPVTPGGELTYTITVDNLGSGPAHNVTVVDHLPPGVTIVSIDPSQGSCTNSPTIVTCHLGTVGPGVTPTIKIVVLAPSSTGPITNVATLTTEDVDTNDANNGARVTTLVQGGQRFCPGFEDDPRTQIVGTPRKDRLVGTSGDDIICGLGKHDVLKGRGGDDLILGNGGGDLLRGGSGNDEELGGKGADVIKGGPGMDTENGGAGRDDLRGNDGSDHLLGSGGDDRLSGQLGPDDLHGGDGNDTLKGGKGGDSLTGGTNEDDLDGGPGDDSCVEADDAQKRCET